MNRTSRKPLLKRLRVRAGLFVIFLGFFLFILGAKPEFFGLDRSPVIGFVQIAVFLTGLGMICVGGYAALDGLWNGMSKTIAPISVCVSLPRVLCLLWHAGWPIFWFRQ
jgi:hypothetical protein